MADLPSTGNTGTRKGKLRLEAPKALASIDYNSIIASDKGTSSEDEGPEAQAIPGDDAQWAVGVSISQEQARLTSPKTPAIEKAAAIDRAEGSFDGGDGAEDTLDEELEDDEDIQAQNIKDGTVGAKTEHGELPVRTPEPGLPERSPPGSPVRLPSPWRADSPARWQVMSKARPGFLEGLLSNRQRALTGHESTTEGWQRWLPSGLPSMPSMPKRFSIASSFGSPAVDRIALASSPRPTSKPEASYTSKLERTSNPAGPALLNRPRSESDGRVSEYKQMLSEEPEEEEGVVGVLPPPHSMQGRRASSRLLNRSTSDQSLVTRRTLSTVESLGDDSRFEHVQDQVNSRLKAIKDSWQDSNIKLPSLSSFSVSSFTPDFLRERSNSANKRHSVDQTASTGSVANSSSVVEHSFKHAKPVDPITRQPYMSPKDALSATAAGKAASHPHSHQALEQLEGDIVILGGYRGSILRSAEPPYRQLWVPVKVGLNLRKADLEVGMEEGDDERASEKIIPDGMLTHIGPVDMSRRLLKRLRSCKHARSGKLRVHDYGYDWRLDPHYLSDGLIKFLETLQCNTSTMAKQDCGAIVIAHSLGGLITRHAVNRRPELFRGVVYAGVPTTCVNILGPLRNGDEVLLSNRVLTAQVNFSIRTSFALLPLDSRCFIDKNTKEEYPVDFFDPQSWIDYKLSPCVGRPLPPLNPPPKPTGITSYVSSMASVLPSLPGRGRKSSPISKISADPSKATALSGALEPDSLQAGSKEFAGNDNDEAATSVRTAVTIPREKAIEYLTRTLASVKKFKQELDSNKVHATSNAYPPISVIYGKSTPTVYGAKVDGREGIKHADAYGELAFASGDGVVLARAAQAPPGYTTARGGVVSSERGHVTLLSDLEAVGKCLNAVIAARRKGVGYGKPPD